jgi:serine/threonine-protein kinase
MIGQILKEHYEIIEPVGSGGMSVVYKAMDLKLNREVAVKVLRDEYVNDEDFLRRFRREAESVQRLNHPNLVATYDVQVNYPPYYIIMEFVHGQTLDLVIDQGPMSYEQAVEYAIQITRALVHAHGHGVIHRDLKPHNMIINEEGKLKLTDFGIALTVNDDTLIHTRAIVGSVHYFSPEQAQGVQINEQSDLYSLGAVIYEMLSGQPPFSGENPVELALKHIQEEPDPILDYCPDLPPEIEAIIEKLLEKAPEDRYESAELLLEDLENIQKAGIFPVENRPRKVKPLTSIEKAELRRKKVIWMRRGVLAAFILLVLLLAGIGINRILFSSSGDSVLVPDLTGKSLSDAVAILDERNLNYQILESIYDKDKAEGIILKQTPTANSEVREGRIVNLTVSRGLEMKQVPLLVGNKEREAIAQLQNDGFEVRVVKVLNSTVEEGQVISQEPESYKRVPLGTEITLTVSAGKQKVKVPDVFGLSIEEAQKALEAKGLTLGEIVPTSDLSLPQNTVTAQQPGADSEVDIGTSVSITRNEGAQTATITISFDDHEESLIKVLVTDKYATYPIRVVYEGTHLKGEQPLELEFPIVSPATVEIYRNGRLESSRKF